MLNYLSRFIKDLISFNKEKETGNVIILIFEATYRALRGRALSRSRSILASCTVCSESRTGQVDLRAQNGAQPVHPLIADYAETICDPRLLRSH